MCCDTTPTFYINNVLVHACMHAYIFMLKVIYLTLDDVVVVVVAVAVSVAASVPVRCCCCDFQV